MVAQRHVLGERHRVPLGVQLRQVRRRCRGATGGPRCAPAPRRGRAAPRRPGSARRSRRRPGRSAPRRRGCAAGRCRRSSPATPPGRVGAGVPAATCGGELEGGVDVVVQHRLALGVEVQPEARHVALHDRHGDRRRRRRRRRPARAARPRHAPAPRRPARPPAPHRPARRAAPRRGASAASAAATSSPPASATAKVTSGAPPSAASRSSGESSWLNASRPHGNPPNGVRSRSASCPTHSSAGQRRPRPPAPVGQRRHPGGGRAEQRQVAGLQQGQQHPRQVAGVQVRPVQQRREQRHPGQEAQAGAGAQPPPVRRGGQQRHARPAPAATARTGGTPPAAPARPRPPSARPAVSGSGRGSAAVGVPPSVGARLFPVERRHRHLTTITRRRLPGRGGPPPPRPGAAGRRPAAALPAGREGRPLPRASALSGGGRPGRRRGW